MYLVSTSGPVQAALSDPLGLSVPALWDDLEVFSLPLTAMSDPLLTSWRFGLPDSQHTVGSKHTIGPGLAKRLLST